MSRLIGMDVSGVDSLGALLSEALIRNKGGVALIEARRKRESQRLTYAEVHTLARRVAARLEGLGVGPDSRVAILLSNQPAWLITAVAALWRGAVLVPLDHKLEPDEQAALIAHCAPQVVVTEYSLFRVLPELQGPTVLVAEAPADAELGDALRWEQHPVVGSDEVVLRRREDPACIVYSSGTGGRAKGCVLGHGAYLSQLEALLERFPMAPGDRYFSILPTNHAIDFMVGFVGPFVCGATVVHQRTLRPELLRWTMQRYGITHMAVVPLILTAFERAIRERLEGLSGWKRAAFDGLLGANRSLTHKRPRPELSRRLLAPIHAAFGGRLQQMFCGGAFTDRRQAEFFYDLGLPVVIGYGLTEACTVVTVNHLSPFRADSVGAPVTGVEVRIDDPDAHGVGEVLVRGPTLMQGYLDDPELTAETVRDGWLHTGDLGWFDASRHLHLCGRSKDVIVTAGGKNVYPEDIEHAFHGVPVEELAVFAANTLWPQRTMTGDRLVAVVRVTDAVYKPSLAAANRALPDFKRLSGLVEWSDPFPRTASMKLKRRDLASEVGSALSQDQLTSL